MTTQEIANALVKYNREHNEGAAYNELYDENAVSTENWGPTPDVYTGLQAIREKSAKWFEGVAEIHSTSCSEPLVADNSFAITYTMDITYKEMGRISMTELAVYKVKDGKIVSEEFMG
jgi:hypothetical protein